MEPLRGNIWKYFVYLFSQRRHFIPLLAIYFLTLPDTTAQQIGLYTGIGYAASFLVELPSSYFADRIGHKVTLVIAKAFMVLSTILFILADKFWYFAAGAACMAISTACSGGVGDAFMHDTMRALKRESEYTKILSKIKAYVSLISGILIVCLPLLTVTSMLLPFYIVLAIDVVGLIVVSMLHAPGQEQDTAPVSLRQITNMLRTAV
ncbi:TPA: MFS transporter, partial [Candidatus Woesearchaeota archaeon]|nr:MFS transporter [Candidatus Woesearchaeota archaeon]